MAEPDLAETRELATTLVTTLQGRSQTLATAESLTGGLLASIVTGVPGASAVFQGGAVTYATEVKQQLLGVSDENVEKDGVVSAACAEAMAAGVRDLLGKLTPAQFGWVTNASLADKVLVHRTAEPVEGGVWIGLVPVSNGVNGELFAGMYGAVIGAIKADPARSAQLTHAAAYALSRR